MPELRLRDRPVVFPKALVNMVNAALTAGLAPKPAVAPCTYGRPRHRHIARARTARR